MLHAKRLKSGSRCLKNSVPHDASRIPSPHDASSLKATRLMMALWLWAIAAATPTSPTPLGAAITALLANMTDPRALPCAAVEVGGDVRTLVALKQRKVSRRAAVVVGIGAELTQSADVIDVASGCFRHHGGRCPF